MCNQIWRQVIWISVGLLLAAIVSVAPQTASADQCIADDLVVDGSINCGFDSVCNRNFGFDTLVLSENNLRIFFEDTSNSASFPDNDWRILINQTSNGGDEFFAVEDTSAGRIPFTIQAGARSNALFIRGNRNIGFGTALPVVNLHIVDGNTPTVRLDQDGSQGFTPQVWDVAGNEANFFIRDVTNGSKLPFRITPNTPNNTIRMFTDKITINDGGADYDTQIKGDNEANLFYADAGTDRIGIGTATPIERLEVVGTITSTGGAGFIKLTNSLKQTRASFEDVVGNGGALNLFNNANALGVRLRGFGDSFFSQGRLGIGNSGPTADLDIGNAVTFSRINAGASTFTASSSRTLKENIHPVQTDDILAKVAKVPVMTYDWKPEVWSGTEEERKNKMGLIAEDFHTVLERGSDKEINGQDVDMALWLAVQQLSAENEKLKTRLEQLEQQVQSKDQP